MGVPRENVSRLSCRSAAPLMCCVTYPRPCVVALSRECLLSSPTCPRVTGLGLGVCADASPGLPLLTCRLQPGVLAIQRRHPQLARLAE